MIVLRCVEIFCRFLKQHERFLRSSAKGFSFRFLVCYEELADVKGMLLLARQKAACKRAGEKGKGKGD
jgi:hypothetical protein